MGGKRKLSDAAVKVTPLPDHPAFTGRHVGGGMPPIPDLPLIRTGRRGNPNKWSPEVPGIYKRYIEFGYSHEEILRSWGVSQWTFTTNWVPKSDLLREVYEKRFDVVVKSDSPADGVADHTPEGMRDLANEVLQELIRKMRARPDAFKPSEIITACREGLDRSQGKSSSKPVAEKKKPAHEVLESLSPEEAYRRLVGDEL